MNRPGTFAGQIGKRTVDIVVSFVLLVLLSPILIAIAIMVKRSSEGPVLFVQPRVGQGERPFALYKFRTMRVANDDSEHREFVAAQIAQGGDAPKSANGTFKLADPRVTEVGHTLRRYSLDELPQLFNVLNGSMSLVGPRPSLPWEVELFSDRHRGRAAAVPGCSGLWQVSGRNRLSMLEMLDLDIDYIENWSFFGDLGILIRTPIAIVRGDGAR